MTELQDQPVGAADQMMSINLTIRPHSTSQFQFRKPTGAAAKTECNT